MGLDISAYSRVFDKKYLLLEKLEDERELENHEIYLYGNGHFSKHQDGIGEGVYSFKGDYFSFGAGSYGTYGEWRRELRSIVNGEMEDQDFYSNYHLFENTPFFELINFSDCEGFIGPKTSKKLYNDFAKHENRFKGEDEYFLDKYEKWKEAFRLASNNGIVDFH